MRHLLFILFCFLLIGCNETKPPVKSEPTKQALPEGYFDRDSFIIAMLEGLGEPNFIHAQRKYEAFRIVWKFPFGDMYYVYRIQQDTLDKYSLTTKIVCIAETDSATVHYEEKTIRYHRSVLLDSSVQSITVDDWLDFIGMINSTFYLNYESPAPHFPVIDGTSMIMESLSMDHDLKTNESKYVYHLNKMHPPAHGFYDALVFLAKKSKVTGKWNLK